MVQAKKKKRRFLLRNLLPTFVLVHLQNINCFPWLRECEMHMQCKYAELGQLQLLQFTVESICMFTIFTSYWDHSNLKIFFWNQALWSQRFWCQCFWCQHFVVSKFCCVNILWCKTKICV